MPLFVKGKNIRIVGVYEKVPCIAWASERNADGSPIYEGESKMLWDEQAPVMDGRQYIWVDENHDTRVGSEIEERSE